ncbi:hypothetical protein PENSPDRAFT_754873 [Peniophora sp. CONT]|nr:hypothetical protein PENSPDRAFT_754873 [Peniophora sp. CONT]
MGLFSTLRRNQSRVSSSSSSSFVHVQQDSDSPSLPNQAPTPTPQRSAMFRRKKQSTPASAAVSESGHLSAPPPRGAASVSSIGDDDTPLSPPPRRSALFGGSTQSLPDAAHGPRPGLHETLSTPDVKQKKGLFSWARSNKQQSTTTLKPPPVPHMPNSAPPSSRNPKLPSPDEKRGPDDFSLRAFRHVTSTSPGASPVEPPPRAPSALSSYTDLPPPRPRPRGTSTASDASQRVSVAAFREMQARRSAAGSPTPSASPRVSTRRVAEFIPPIGRSELRPPIPSAYSTTSMYSASGSASGSSPNVARQTKPQPQQTRGSMFAGADESSSEEEEEEEESGEDEPTLRPGRRNTIRGKGRQSELGTRMQPPRAPALQNSGRSASAGSVSASPVRDGRKPSGGVGMSIAASRSRTTLASSSSSDSDDDAPLAQFMMPPRSRAGSAASGRFPVPPKPLVDLGGLKLPSSTSLVNADGQSPTTAPNPGGRIPPVPRRTMDMSELESSSSGHGLGRMPQPTRAATLGVEMGVDSAFSPPSPAVENLAASLSPAGSVSPQAPASSASPSMGANLNSSTTSPSVPQAGASPAVSPNPSSAEAPARGRARSASLGLGLAERLSQFTAGLARSPSPGPNRAVSPGPVRGMSPGPGRAVSPGPSAALVSPTPSTGLASPPPVPALDPAPSNNPSTEAGQTSSRHLRRAADHENPNPTLNLPPPRESSLAPLPNSVSARLGMASANSTTTAYSVTSSFKNRTGSGRQVDSDSDEESEDEKDKSGSPEPPIIPVPVKERPRGPPSFAVTSRPGGHGRSTSVGTVGSGSGSIDWTGQGHGRSESQATVTVGGGAASPTHSTVRMVGSGARREKEEELPAPRPSPARRTPVRSMTAEQQRLPPAGPISSTSSSSAQHNKIARPALPASFTHSSASTSTSSAKSPVSTVSSAQFPGSSAISSAASSATASTSSGSTGASPYGGILKNSASRSPQQTKQPPRPWARDDSPSSSTGGSSSSRAPATPRDGSELGVPMQGSSLLGGGRAKHKRQSVSFGDAEGVRGLGIEKSGGEKGKAVVSEEVEERRRRERRRSEARAAIELGNVMNGRAPVTQDDEDDAPLQAQPLFPHNTGPAGMGGMGMFPGMQGMQMPGMMPQMPQMTGSPGMMPQMPMGMQGMQGMNGMNMQGMGMGMQDQQNMMAAHQHAMLIAKQTYQWAVAQQAMAAAADEWERTGGSVAGWNPSTAGSVYGGGAESVVGFPSSASVAGFPASGRAPSMFMNQGMNMGGMGGGMGMNPMMMGSGGSVVGGMGGMGSPWGYMNSAQSMYAGSTYSPSEVGGPSQRPNFSSSRSEYGGGERSSRAFRAPPVPAMPSGMQQGQQGQGRGGPRQRTLTAPGGQSAPGPGGVKTKKSGPLLGHIAPPSSWKGPGKGPA